MKFINLDRQSNKLKKKNISSIKKLFKNSEFIMGKDVLKLEEKLKNYVGARYCVSTSSGTDALLIALMSLNLKKGSEVITTPFTYVSTVEIILRLGMKPVFVDVDYDTCNISVDEIKKKISKKTKAIIPVSLFGQPAKLKKINALAKTYNIPVIEDAAQSFGSKYLNKKSCNLTNIGCTSFFPTKSLGCYGDGGALFTNNKSIADKCKVLRSHGQRKKYNYEVLGVNARLDTIQASFLLNKLTQFDQEIKKRIHKAEYYFKNLNFTNIKFFKTDKGNFNIYTLFNIKVKNRKKLIDYLKEKKIPTMIYYPKPLHFYKPFRNYVKKSDTFSNSIRLSKEILSLPFSPYITKKEQDKVINSIRMFYKN